MSRAQQNLDISKTVNRPVGGRYIFALCIDANIRREIIEDVRIRKNLGAPVSMKVNGVLIGSIK